MEPVVLLAFDEKSAAQQRFRPRRQRRLNLRIESCWTGHPTYGAAVDRSSRWPMVGAMMRHRMEISERLRSFGDRSAPEAFRPLLPDDQ